MSKEINLKILIDLLKNLDLSPSKEEILVLIKHGAELKKDQRIKLYLDWIKKHENKTKNLPFKVDNILEFLIGLTHLYRSMEK